MLQRRRERQEPLFCQMSLRTGAIYCLRYRSYEHRLSVFPAHDMMKHGKNDVSASVTAITSTITVYTNTNSHSEFHV